MKKKIQRLLAALLACLMLAGCGSDFMEYAQDMLEAWQTEPTEDTKVREQKDWDPVVAFEDMVYTRPDMEALQQSVEGVCKAAEGDNVMLIVRRLNGFYNKYDEFYTNYSLADIYYSMDLTDSYWEEEYNYCMEQSAQVDAATEEICYALAKSPCLPVLESDAYFGEGYFDAYQGENLWGEEFTAMLEQESALVGRYYELAGIGVEYEMGSEEYYDACGDAMAEVLVELIRLRQEMADYWDYEDYIQFATDFYYYRDYTPAQSEQYLQEIRQELVPLYVQVSQTGGWYDGLAYCTEEQTYAYVQEMARNMGGTVAEAFDLMDRGGLYDISYGENKYNASYEVYLTSYEEPFILMNPEGTTYDYLTFAHEFGHFCNDYASYGSYAGVDVLEFFSQGMEYLSLCYVDGAESLTKLKMLDSLSLYVEQAAFASFEMGMYRLTGEELTAENLYALYDETAVAFGFKNVGYDPREFVSITHFYTNPMYIMSYVVSNDAAMQLYQRETEAAGEGLACFEENLDTEEYYFLSFLDSAGLDSPFSPGRLQSVRETFEDILD